MTVDLLKEDDELFRLAIEASPAAMIVTDVQGRIRFVNAETLRMFGYETIELGGNGPLNLLFPKICAKITAHLQRDFFRNPSKRAMGVGQICAPSGGMARNSRLKSD